jgi:hypothetical protein
MRVANHRVPIDEDCMVGGAEISHGCVLADNVHVVEVVEEVRPRRRWVLLVNWSGFKENTYQIYRLDVPTSQPSQIYLDMYELTLTE